MTMTLHLYQYPNGEVHVIGHRDGETKALTVHWYPRDDGATLYGDDVLIESLGGREKAAGWFNRMADNDYLHDSK